MPFVSNKRLPNDLPTFNFIGIIMTEKTTSPEVQPVSYHHSHIAKPDAKSQKKIMIAGLVTASYMMVEMIGGLWVNSIALVADGVHMMTDAVALGIAWWGAFT